MKDIWHKIIPALLLAVISFPALPAQSIFLVDEALALKLGITTIHCEKNYGHLADSTAIQNASWYYSHQTWEALPLYSDSLTFQPVLDAGYYNNGIVRKTINEFFASGDTFLLQKHYFNGILTHSTVSLRNKKTEGVMPLSTSMYEPAKFYDEKGRVIEERTCNGQYIMTGCLVYSDCDITHYYYDDQDRVIRLERLDSFHSLISFIEITYNAKGLTDRLISRSEKKDGYEIFKYSYH